MADPYYVGGGITLNQGERTASLDSGALLANALQGDTLEIDGIVGTIESVDDDTTFTLLYDWAGDSVAAADEYVIKHTSPGWNVGVAGPAGGQGIAGTAGAAGSQIRKVIDETALLPDLGLDNDLAITTSPPAVWFKESGAYDLVVSLGQGPIGPPGPKGDKGDQGGKGDAGDKGTKGDTGFGIVPDAVGTLSQRAVHDNEAAGFVFIETDVTPFPIFIKNSNTTGDWSDASFIGGTTAIGDWGSFADAVSESFDFGSF